MPGFSGLHHVKLPVRDLAVAVPWYERALGAEVDPALDHRTPDGLLFARILRLPGVPVPIELRLAPRAAAAVAGYDPLTLAVEDQARLREWTDHLDAAGIERSPVLRSLAGHLVVLRDPDGLMIRIHTVPGPLIDPAEADLGSPWVSTELMAPR
ncbi:VOC family protein [Amycolatopsis sp. PS_44_ISF1]|uniref:VOC family protein n=1 Tax=Amycolatopsis sp. PS_44_ISF1 TaxID=2974917 RepID=UPI0028DFF4CA|nr:VOC family protein [Amycolatopsis sp. PS_44_ISF1]MDT8913446.1 VOC family protein [Amycolatopsis sp. PS_44_ISF1]